MSNAVELNGEAMAARIWKGRRVVRGADWLLGSTDDGQPRMPGTVVSEHGGRAVVEWDCGNKGTYMMGLKLGGRPVYQLKLLPDLGPYSEVNDIRKGDPSFVNLQRLSCSRVVGIQVGISAEKANFLTTRKLNKALIVMNLHCDVSPEWSKEVLRRVAPRLKGLRLLAPDVEHLAIVQTMPALESLFLASVDTEMVNMALSMPKLVDLEVQCPFEAPLGELRLPEQSKLTFLCVGVYPLSAAMALVRANAATLTDLWLVAASRMPYGCPDLAAELRGCRLKNLTDLVLERESDIHFCQHDVHSCQEQTHQLWSMFYETGLAVKVTCRQCG